MHAAEISQLLCLCISAGHVSLALTLMPHVSEVDLPDSTGATALMLAADAGHHELIVPLLDLGASVRAEDSQGRTALSRACQAGHVRAAKTLADRGADVSHLDHQGLTCVQLAKKLEHMDVVHLLQFETGRSVMLSVSRYRVEQKLAHTTSYVTALTLCHEFHRLSNILNTSVHISAKGPM